MRNPIEITAFELAQRFVGIKEIPGSQDNPHVLAMLKLDGDWPEHDEVAWCSAFTNYIAWLLRLPRSKRLNARSWLDVGVPIQLGAAEPGFDVVVFWRGSAGAATGHVGFFAGREGGDILVLGGNQNNQVSVARYDGDRLLGIRRLR